MERVLSIHDLPSDAIVEVFRRFPFGHMLKMRLVCRRWRSLVASVDINAIAKSAEQLRALHSVCPGLRSLALYESIFYFRFVGGRIESLTRFTRLQNLLLAFRCTDPEVCVSVATIFFVVQVSIPGPKFD